MSLYGISGPQCSFVVSGESGSAVESYTSDLQFCHCSTAEAAGTIQQELAFSAVSTSVNLSKTEIEDESFFILAELLIGVTELNISDTNVTVEGLRQISKLENIKSLDISGAKITDSALPVLRAMDSLESLTMLRTQMSRRAVANLREAMPHLNITMRDRDC